MTTQKRTFKQAGYLQIVEKLKNSSSGNPAYLFMVEGVAIRTKPNSALEHEVKTWKGSHVEVEYYLDQKENRILSSIKLAHETPEELNYIENQFSKLAWDGVYNGTIKLTGSSGSTNSISITESQAKTIMAVLLGHL